MSQLPLLIGLGIAGYFLLQSKSKSSSLAGSSVRSFPGYDIINCKDFKITDEEKAFRYAFETGLKYPIKNLRSKLFHECVPDNSIFGTLNVKNQKNADFYYKLKHFYFSGMLASDIIAKNNFEVLMMGMRGHFMDIGVTINGWPNQPVAPAN